MGSVSGSSCICWMFVSCVHPVAVLNAAFCMTCSLLMLVSPALSYSCRLMERYTNVVHVKLHRIHVFKII